MRMIQIMIMILIIILFILVTTVSIYLPAQQHTTIDNIPIYIINLKNRPDRKRRILNELSKHNINHSNTTIIDAINGNDLNISWLMKKNIYRNDETIYRPMRRGEIGCYLSHIKCWDMIAESGHDYALVIEDDVVFVDNFKQKINNMLTELANYDWDVFCLGRNCKTSHGFDGFCKNGAKINNFLYPDVLGYATFAYIIRSDCIKKILPSMTPITQPIDMVTLEKNRDKEIKFIVPLNNMVNINNFKDSDTISIK